MENYQKLIDEYNADYCHFLEAAYGDNMLAEGGADAIKQMFKGVDLNHKKCLDVGCGLGGVAFYVAEHYHAEVTGLELNPWFVAEASKRTPAALKSKVNFISYQQPPIIPLPDHSVDVIYSKGVLTHINDKLPLFEEFVRVLKPGSQLVIDDWLSPSKGRWGARLQKMCEMEDLTLYAETEDAYRQLLSAVGFKQITMRNENSAYEQYNLAVVAHLQKADVQHQFIQQFGEKAWREAVEAYQLIADSMRDNELLIRNIRAVL